MIQWGLVTNLLDKFLISRSQVINFVGWNQELREDILHITSVFISFEPVMGKIHIQITTIYPSKVSPIDQPEKEDEELEELCSNCPGSKFNLHVAAVP